MTKWACAVFLMALGIVSASEARGDCNDPFGKPHEVLDFQVKLKRADWTALRASKVRPLDGVPVDSPACMDEFPEFPAEFRCGNEGPWLQIAVRKKRGTERGEEAPEKPPLKLDLNEDFMGKQPAAKGQRWPAPFGDLGYRKLSLNNGQSNKAADRIMLLPVLLQEFVALRLLRREVPSTPGVAYAKVTLFTEDKPAGEYHGVYILIEDIDRTAIRRRWGKAEGRLLKQSKSACSPAVEYDDGPPNAAQDAFNAWVGKNPATIGANGPAEAAKGVDLDALLRQEAIREILVNGDDTNMYSALSTKQGNNWIAFDPRVGMRQYMPWDLDLTFGQQYGNCMPTPLKCPPNTALLRYCPTTASTVGKLTVCQPEVQKRYLQIMCQLTRGTLAGTEILKEWEKAYAAVSAIVPLEKDLIWGGKNPADPTIDKSFGAEYLRLKAWIPERIKSVQQQLTMRGISCTPGCTAGEKESCRYLSCAGERRCENNAWTECRPLGACPPPPADGSVPVAVQPTADAGASRDVVERSALGSQDAGAMATGAGGTMMPGQTSDPTAGGGSPLGTGGIAMASKGQGGRPNSSSDNEPQDAPDARGCACSAGRSQSGSGLWVLLGLSLWGLRRRHRAGSRKTSFADTRIADGAATYLRGLVPSLEISDATKASRPTVSAVRIGIRSMYRLRRPRANRRPHGQPPQRKRSAIPETA